VAARRDAAGKDATPSSRASSLHQTGRKPSNPDPDRFMKNQKLCKSPQTPAACFFITLGQGSSAVTDEPLTSGSSTSKRPPRDALQRRMMSRKGSRSEHGAEPLAATLADVWISLLGSPFGGVWISSIPRSFVLSSFGSDSAGGLPTDLHG